MVQKASNPKSSIKNIISLRKIDKTLNHKQILKNISFDVKQGEILALLGPNGAGKTTTLRIILGLMRPDKGLVRINQVTNPSIYQKRFCFALMEKDFFWLKYSALQNIYLICQLLNVAPCLIQRGLQLYSAKLNLDTHLDQGVHTFSKGMQRKLSLLCGLITSPELLILDEPTTGLDPSSRQDIRELLIQLSQQGKTIIVTSHDLAEIEKTANRAHLIVNGKLLKWQWHKKRQKAAGGLENYYLQSLKTIKEERQN